MSKKVVFLGLAAVVAVCAVKHAVHYHHDEIRAKSRKRIVNLNKDKTVKAPAGRHQICPVTDINALRGAHRRGQRV